MRVAPVVASGVAVRCDPILLPLLHELVGGRPIVIDHYATRRCGVTIGDLRVRVVASADADRDGGSSSNFVDLERVEGERVLAEPALLPLLAAGATLRQGRFLDRSALTVELDEPAAWLEFLDAHPGRRR